MIIVKNQKESRQNKPLVSVVILNWNGKRYLNDCLTSLENQSFTNFEIIFADNGSEDDSVSFVKENFPKTIIVENKKNLGFAEGNNRGIRIAQGKYVFILNNDTKVDKNCLEKLVEVAERNDKIGMAATKILSIQNSKLIDSVGVNIYFDGMSRGRGRKEIDNGQYDKIEKILIPSGCAALYRKEMLDEIGLFDERFFAYCEDTDLGLRGRLAGWQAQFVPSAVIQHYYSGTSGKYSSFKAFLVERNHFWVVLKNFPPKLILFLPFYTVLRYSFIIFGLLTKRGAGARYQSPKFQLVFILLKSYISALRGLPEMLNKRKFIQKNKKLNNKEIYNLFKKYSLRLSEITLND
ncbi:MAG: glycosyltransferase family 2 protein [Candidatus Pacebacteria bacterium]|nr:glycosyltransferase family 2 protein [Candidatus Paceibacterota bacterium]